MQKINKQKADKLIAKGDRLKAKGKFEKALKKYKKAKKYDPERADLYDRLIEAHDKSTKEWCEEDVAESVGYVMDKQEIENPSIKLLHERLTPEWTKVTEKIGRLIISDNEAEESEIIQEIQAFGPSAVYPLIYTLLQIKKGAGETKGEICGEEKKE